MNTHGQIHSGLASFTCGRRAFVTVGAFGFGVLSILWPIGQRVLAGQPEATVLRRQPGRNGEPQARSNRLAVDPRPRRPRRFPFSLDRRILLEAERKGRRDDRYHGLDPTATAVPDRDVSNGILWRARARPVATLGPFQGTAQTVPTPGTKNLHECRWPPSVRFTIPGDWLSGVYLGRLTTVVEGDTEPYWQSYVIFIVRDDRPADILFQCSDNTWQAYNRWPNHFSLYTHPRGNQGPWADVSFDRPYGREAQHDGVVNDPLTFGSGEFLPFEFPLAYWLEQHGYDVTYCSNSDMLTPDRGLRCKAFLSVGHDEYWDIRQFRSVARMRDDGVSLLFFSGNALCWVTPYRDSNDGRPNRIIFRGGPYGADNDYARRRQKENGPFPEHGPDEGLLMGARNVEPVNGGGDWVVARAEHWMFEGTGLKNGDRIPGLIGWEYHGDPPKLSGLEVVAAGTAWVGGQIPQNWTATFYPGSKGNFVFNASTIFWAQGLSSPPGHTLPWSHWSRPHGPDERVQMITHNLLRHAIRRGP